MKKIILAGAAALCLSNFATASTIMNGSFETGDFTGWLPGSLPGGATSVSTTDAGETATDGTFFANLTADSYLAQDLTWYAGTVLKFDWNFIANDSLPFNDFSIFEVRNPIGDLLEEITLADIGSLGTATKTGWQTYHHTFTSSGSGFIGFGAVNDFDTNGDSQLFIDNVLVSEPISLGLTAIALAGLGLARRRSE